MQIALIDSAPLAFGGGFERFLLDLAKRGASQGHTVTLLEPRPRVTKAISLATTLHAPHLGLSDRDVQGLAGGAKWKRVGIVETRKALQAVDIIYVKNEPQELLFALALRTQQQRVVVGFHSATQKSAGLTKSVRNWVYDGAFYRRLLRKVDGIHYLAQDQQAHIESTTQLKAPSAVIPNGVDTERFVPSKRERNDEFKVLFIGRLDAQKGIETLCCAVEQLAHESGPPRIRFTVAGSGPLETKVAETSTSTQLIDYVGYVNDATQLYGAHDLVVVPSNWETFGLVAAEALSSAIPVVMSDLPALEHFATDAAMRFSAGDSHALAMLIKQCCSQWNDDSAAYEALGRQGRQFAVNSLGGNVRHDELLEFFESIAVGNGGAER